MATKAKIAQATSGTKDQPVDQAPDHLTAEDRAALAHEREVAGRDLATAEVLLEALRRAGCDNDSVRRGLLMESAVLESIAERIAPGPKRARDMLTDALEVVQLAEECFYNDGELAHPTAVLREAIRAACADIELLRVAADNNDAADWQTYERANKRLELALRISAFREAHGYHKPMPKAEQAEGGAS